MEYGVNLTISFYEFSFSLYFHCRLFGSVDKILLRLKTAKGLVLLSKLKMQCLNVNVLKWIVYKIYVHYCNLVVCRDFVENL